MFVKTLFSFGCIYWRLRGLSFLIRVFRYWFLRLRIVFWFNKVFTVLLVFYSKSWIFY